MLTCAVRPRHMFPATAVCDCSVPSQSLLLLFPANVFCDCTVLSFSHFLLCQLAATSVALSSSCQAAAADLVALLSSALPPGYDTSTITWSGTLQNGSTALSCFSGQSF